MRPTLPAASPGRRRPARPAELTKAQLQARVHALEHQVRAMEHSTSWRLTAPVRWVSRTLQRLRGAPVPVDTTGGNYAEWIARSAALQAAGLVAMASEAGGWAEPVRISVLMPTYNPKPDWLREAIDSVRAQTYAHWELCIADDASTDLEVARVLDAAAAADARIRWVRRPVNGHISEASNSALALAGGEWVVLMDHDDLLAPDALLRVAHETRRHPEAGMIYSDEDKIDALGHRYNPYFKPDWNLDLFRSQNMFSHLGAYRRALVLEVGGFRKGFEGAQDHDLALRCIERLDAARQVRHIPHVLYHWRAHAESTAQSAGAKPYAEIAGERALDEHFERIGLAARSEGTPHGYRMRLAAPARWPRVSLIVPTRDALGLVRQCIESIVSLSTYPDYEIVLVDNGSTDPEALAYFDELRRSEGFQVLRDDGEFDYAALNNTAVARASGEVVALVNNDIEVISPDWLEEMVALALQPGVGAVGAKLLYPDDTVQHGGIVLGIGGIAGHAHKHLPRSDGGYFNRAQLVQSFCAVTAACLVVRKAVYEEVGGLDAVHLKVSYNDVDFCLRLREAGYRNLWTPYAELYHHESATRPRDLDPAQRERAAREENYMKTRWAAPIADDPAYSPNLSLDAEDFRLAWPPRSVPADRPGEAAR